MYLVSVISDDFNKRHGLNAYKQLQEFQMPVKRSEFEALKKEVELLKDILKKAKEFDEKTGQPDCEKDDKVLLLKSIAEKLGVDLNDVFK